MTAAKVELGRWLFYDTRLSGNRTMSCGSCHQQAYAFAEPRVVTTTSAEIERSQHVLYVLPEDRAPITMFVTDAENEGSSISLTLIPKEGGVREIDVAVLEQETIRDANASSAVRKALKSAIKAKPIDPYGKPCRLCRKDDTGDDYGSDNDRW